MQDDFSSLQIDSNSFFIKLNLLKITMQNCQNSSVLCLFHMRNNNFNRITICIYCRRDSISSFFSFPISSGCSFPLFSAWHWWVYLGIVGGLDKISSDFFTRSKAVSDERVMGIGRLECDDLIVLANILHGIVVLRRQRTLLNVDSDTVLTITRS